MSLSHVIVIVDLYILILDSILLFFALYLGIKASMNSAILEIRLLTIFVAVSLISALSLFISHLIVFLDEINTSALLYVNLSIISLSLSIIFLQLAFFLVDFEFRYSRIFLLSMVIFVDTVFVMTTIYEKTTLFIEGNYLRFTTGPSFFPMFILVQLILVTLIISRFVQIKRLLDNNSSFLLSPIYYLILPLLFIVAGIFGGIVDSNPSVNLPTELRQIPITIFYLIIMLAVQKNNHFLFVLPIKLHAIIVTYNDSGSVIYSESINSEQSPDILLGNLLSALNLSLTEILHSNQNMEELSLGDKIIHIATGELITTLLVTSHRTLMTGRISRHLTRSIEKAHYDEITPVYNLGDLEGFDSILLETKQYFGS